MDTKLELDDISQVLKESCDAIGLMGEAITNEAGDNYISNALFLIQRALRQSSKRLDDMTSEIAMQNIELRKIQMELSKTSPEMAIWLGKQYLGQTESPDREEK